MDKEILHDTLQTCVLLATGGSIVLISLSINWSIYSITHYDTAINNVPLHYVLTRYLKVITCLVDVYKSIITTPSMDVVNDMLATADG